jgi:hypothetical protein
MNGGRLAFPAGRTVAEPPTALRCVPLRCDPETGLRMRRRVLRRSGSGLVVLLALACGSAASRVELAAPAPTPEPGAGAVETVAAPPIRLVGSRGIPLRLAKLDVAGVVEDPLAFTELRMVFENPEPGIVDARLEVELPRAARTTRFAVRDDAGWREAEVVERRAASTVDPLRVGGDPILEDPGPHRVFRAQLRRIGGRARVEVVLSYAQTFDEAGDEYRVALAGLRRVAAFDANVLVTQTVDDPTTTADERGTQRVVAAERWTGEDIVVALSGERQTAVRHGEMVVARVSPLSHDHPEPMHGLTVLFDTSASRAVGYREQVARLGAVVDQIGRQAGGAVPVRIVAFDQTVRPIWEGRAGALRAVDLEALVERRALGASNLRAAIDWVASHRAVGFSRLLLVSDGLATAGDLQRSALVDAVARLATVGVVRVDVWGAGEPADARLLERLARALPRRGLLLAGATGPEELARRLLRTVTDDVRIEVPGAMWHFPERVDGLQAEDEVLVYAQIDPRRSVDVHAHSSHDRDLPQRVAPTPVDPHLVESAWMAGRVEFLADALERSGSEAAVYRRKAWRQIVQLSTRHRLLNEWTTLSVAQPGLDANDGTDILVAGPLGVQILARDAVVDEAGSGPVTPELPPDPLDIEQLVLVADDPATRPVAGPLAGEPGRPATPDDPPRAAEPPEGGATPVVVQRTLTAIDPALAAGLGDAYSGHLLAVMSLLGWGRLEEATEMATAWREAEPGDVMALVALGETLEASDRRLEAARAYGSIIDLFPHRADMRRFAGQRLERLGPVGGNLALDTYQRAREQRPEHPSSHRLYAFALLRAGDPRRAFDVLARAVVQGFPEDQFGPVGKVMREDLGLVAAAWIRQRPKDEELVTQRLSQVGAVLETRPSLRFVLTWETSGADVDLHVRDAEGHHAFWEQPVLDSGGMLYGDVKHGFGPEEFTISGIPQAYPYGLSVHYYARGPLGYGMGKVEIIEHAGDGLLKFDERPFVVTRDRAVVDLGALAGPIPVPD